MTQPFDPARAGFEPDADAMRALISTVAERVIAHLASVGAQRASDTEGADLAARALIEPVPETGQALGPLLDVLFRELLPKGYNAVSPGALSFVTGGGLFHAAVADFIATATNPYVGYWAASPGFVEMEHTVVRWFCDVMGLPAGAGGVLTSGGSIANLSALVTARALRLPDDFSRGTLYASDAAHHSIRKAAAIAGFPPRSVRIIPSDASCRIVLAALQAAIEDDRRNGLTPFLLVGMAGTTGTGAIDDLEGLADLAERERLWLHVDAAYGGFFRLTARGRAALSGIERADSVVVDPHKSLFMPFGTGCLLVRREHDLLAAHLVHADCVRESVELGARSAARNPADMSIELTRECRGLRVWLPLKLFGAGAFRLCLDEKLDLADTASDALTALGEVEVLARGLSTIAFRVKRAGYDARRLDRLNRAILDHINRSGRVHLSGADVRGVYAIRICVLSFRAHARSIAECLEDLRAAMADPELDAGTGREPDELEAALDTGPACSVKPATDRQ